MRVPFSPPIPIETKSELNSVAAYLQFAVARGLAGPETHPRSELAKLVHGRFWRAKRTKPYRFSPAIRRIARRRLICVETVRSALPRHGRSLVQTAFSKARF